MKKYSESSMYKLVERIKNNSKPSEKDNLEILKFNEFLERYNKMKKHKFTLEEDFVLGIYGGDIPEFCLKSKGKKLVGAIFKDEMPNVLFMVTYKGYSWNGSDFGATTEKLYHPTLVHDALIQAYHNGLSIKRSDADKIFYTMMKNKGFKLARLYYWAVLIYGKIFSKRKPDEGVEVKEFRK